MPDPNELAKRAAQRLHHVSMRFVGAMRELCTGTKVGFIPSGAPGLDEMRSLIDLCHLTRAEVNGLTKLLIEGKYLKAETVTRTFAEEYEWLAQQKAQETGCEVTDYGLSFKAPSPERN
jgi:hypothetical protein